ncbi:MAG: hypothetical protein LH469_08115 [Frankiaceae bacterium]|nr:hypothetical protein [Frankiaceae bacterium]
MTQREQPQVFEGTDVVVDPTQIEEPAEQPASSDAEQMTNDNEMGGTGGENAGGAG